MKRIMFLFAMLVLLANTSKAQMPFTFHIHPSCSGADVVLYAVQVGTCTIVGQSAPISIPAGPAAPITIMPPYPPAFWTIDPATTCGGCAWEWIAADISAPTACQTTPTTPLNCGSANYDILTIGMPHCGYNHAGDFTYSGPCGTCKAGDCKHANFHPDHMNVH